MFDFEPHTLTAEERARLAAMDDATKSSLYGWVVAMLDFLNEVVGAANLKASDRPARLRTKVTPGSVRLLD
jgi:hypothetical protein